MMNSTKTVLLSFVITAVDVVGVNEPAFGAEDAAAEEVIKHVVALNGTYGRNELDAYFAFFSPDTTLWFDSGGAKLADYKKDWYKLVADGGGVVKNVISDLHVQMGPGETTAVAIYQVDVETRMPDGSITRGQGHETDVWFLGNGQWLVAHLHWSTVLLDTVALPPGAPE
ncbi:MAG: DUF4440 domain-containing protein [Xanthomonadales bacterium]|nr:DUF4440 domain-containing protein [Xanthomonadales bacterium]